MDQVTDYMVRDQHFQDGTVVEIAVTNDFMEYDAVMSVLQSPLTLTFQMKNKWK